jgi:parvulin-like peptidyl-prolyl isomerase
VATVDGRPVTVRQVYGLAAAYRQQYEQRGVAMTPQQDLDLRRTAVQTLINADLMARAAKAEGMHVDPKIIAGRIESDRARFKSEEDYRKALASAKVTEEMIRSDLETQMLAETWVKAKTEGSKVEEATARRVYDDNKDKFKQNDEAHVLQILIASASTDPAAKREEAKKRAEEVLAKAKAGEDFGKLAKQYSQTPNAAKGGDVGFIPRRQPMIFPKFDEMAFTLPVGELSPIFETPKGFNVIKVVERREGKTLSWEEVKPGLMDQMTSQFQAQILEGKIETLRAGSKITYPDLELAPPKRATQAAQTGTAAPAKP